MPRIHFIPLLAVCLFALAASRCLAEDEIDKLIATLNVAKAEFLRDMEAQKQRVLKKFDAPITEVTNNSKVKPADRLSLADKLRAERKALAENEDLRKTAISLPSSRRGNMGMPW